MKKKLLAIALLALGASFSAASYAAPKQDDTIVAVYSADAIYGNGNRLIRVETVASRKSTNTVKLYVREEDIPAKFFESTETDKTKTANTDKTPSGAGGQSN